MVPLTSKKLLLTLLISLVAIAVGYFLFSPTLLYKTEQATEKENIPPIATPTPHTPKDNPLARRLEKHIKEAGAKKIQQQTMKLMQKSMASTPQKRVLYLEQANKLDPSNTTIQTMLREARDALKAAPKPSSPPPEKSPQQPTSPSSTSPSEGVPPASNTPPVTPRIIED